MTVPLVLVGGGGHASVLAGMVQRAQHWHIVGYTDPEDRGKLLGLPYLGGDEALQQLCESGSVTAAVIGIGHVGIPGARITLFKRLKLLGLKLPVIVDRSASIGPLAELGEGTVVMPGAVVNVSASIGMACILNSHATVEHDCTIGSHTHIASGATVCGGCQVGDGAMIGAGAVLVHGVRVGSGCLIGAGATVICDLIEPGIYVGTPARKLR